MDSPTRICRVTKTPFVVGEGEEFLLRRIPELISPLKGIPLPAPTVHPFEALRRIYAFGCLRKLYRATSAVSGQPQLTRYNPALGTKICTYDEFFSDDVDNTVHGVPYDFKRPFFDQFVDLLYRVTLPPLNRRNCEESEYVNGAEDLLRCYLCFAAFRSEDCLYCLTITKCRDCIDCTSCKDCELCYSSRDLVRCYNVEHSTDCTDCQDLFGCVDCRSSRNCFGCVALERAEYCIFNEQHTKEEYQRFLAERPLDHYAVRERALAECLAFQRKLAHRVNTFLDCSNVSGAYLSRCENMEQCYNGISSTNCGYLIIAENSHYVYRGMGTKAEFGYHAHTLGANVCAYSYSIFGGELNLYSAFLLQSCSQCFGSVGLRGKSYCILNREYSKGDYLELLPRIVQHMKSTGEWGEWFPIGKAPHSYQESSVHEYISPIPLETARERGYRVVEPEPERRPEATIEARDLPDRLEQSDFARISSRSISCAETGQLFNLQRRELEAYLRRGIPVPRVHWNQRMQHFLNARELIPAI